MSIEKCNSILGMRLVPKWNMAKVGAKTGGRCQRKMCDPECHDHCVSVIRPRKVARGSTGSAGGRAVLPRFAQRNPQNTPEHPALRQRTRRSGGGAVEAVVDGGGKYEGEDHGAEEAADYGDGEGLEHFGAGAEAEGQREHAGDGGESGHGDGAEAAAAGLNHGFLRREAEGAEALIGVEEQDAVFGDNADDHDDAHEGSDVEGGPGDEKSEEAAKSGEESGSEDGGRGGEGAELKEQDDEEKEQSQEEDVEEVTEGFLLLLEGAAVFDADGRRQVKGADGLLDGSHAGAEANAFEAGGDAHVTLGIFAANFVLAGVGVEDGEGAERGGTASGAEDRSVHHLIEGSAAGIGEADADGIDAIVEDDRSGRRFAFENGGGVNGDFFGSEAGASGGQCIDLKGGSRAADGVLDAIKNVHDAVHFGDGVGNAGSGGEKRLGILGKKIDDDGFGFVAEVADHVLQHLDKLDTSGRLGFIDFLAHAFDDLLDVAITFFLKPDGEIAAIGFGDGR